MEALFDFLDAPLEGLPDELLDLPEEPLPKPIEAYRTCATSSGSSGYGLVVTARSAPPASDKGCPVPACGGAKFGRQFALRQHWLMCHLQSVIMFLCPVLGCKFRSPREDKVKEHATKNHMGAFADKDDMATKLSELPRIIVSNNRYVDPCGVAAPAQLGHILEPVLPAQTKSMAYIPATRKRAADGDLPQGMKCRRSEPASPLKPIDLNQLTIPAASSTLIQPSSSSIPSRKAELIKEYLRNDELIKSATKRNSDLRRTIKRLEAEEHEALRKTVKSRDEEIRRLQDDLRKRDRRIRHLEQGIDDRLTTD